MRYIVHFALWLTVTASICNGAYLLNDSLPVILQKVYAKITTAYPYLHQRYIRHVKEAFSRAYSLEMRLNGEMYVNIELNSGRAETLLKHALAIEQAACRGRVEINTILQAALFVVYWRTKYDLLSVVYIDKTPRSNAKYVDDGVTWEILQTTNDAHRFVSHLADIDKLERSLSRTTIRAMPEWHTYVLNLIFISHEHQFLPSK